MFVLLLVLAGLGYLGYSEHQFGQYEKRLTADLAAFERLRWERPLLRGEPTDGNAAEAIFAAVASLPAPSEALRQGLAEQLFYGQPLLPHQTKVIQQQEAELAALRQSVQRTWSMTYLRPQMGRQMPVPDYQRVVDSVLLLLAHGASQAPDVCLEVCADAIRIGQDLVPGAPLAAASAAMRIASVSEPVVRHCARRASAKGVRDAVRELRTLASHPAPIQHALMLRDLLFGSELRLAGHLPSDAGHLLILKQLQGRAKLLQAWKYFDNPHRFRDISAAAYPESLAEWRKEENWRIQSGIGIVKDSTEGVTGWLYDDMRGQAVVRALTVGLSALAEQHLRGRAPDAPPALNEPALRDPFTGHPMRFKLDAGSLELAVWSVGEDLRDGGARETWSEKAPMDVIAHVRLQPPERRARTPRRRHSR